MCWVVAGISYISKNVKEIINVNAQNEIYGNIFPALATYEHFGAHFIRNFNVRTKMHRIQS